MTDEDTFKRIDAAIQNKDKKNRYSSNQMERIFDNMKFAKKIEESPVATTMYDKKVFGCTTINLGPYIESRVWPRGIYVTDKLLRLVASSRLEFLKRYLKKKNAIGFDYWWILILIFLGIGGVILVIMFLLPQLGAVF